jgi:branched-chain amino acid transport system permease protein
MAITADALASPRQYLQAQIRWHWIEVAFWLAVLLPIVLTPSYLVLASQIAITALFALSLDLILGYAGIVSLGHAAFFGFGAYTAGIITKPWTMSFFGYDYQWTGWGEPLTGLVISGLASGLVGYLMSFIIARFRHLTLIMLTLGLGLLLFETANKASWLTGGADGLQGVNVWRLFGKYHFDLWGYTSYLYALVVLFLLFLVSRRLTNSPFGLSLRGIRENIIRMRAIGAESRSHLRTVYTISAAIAGIAGALLTQTTGTVSLGVIDFQRSADVLVILVLGGAGRLYGGLIGAIIFMVARDQFSGINPQYWYFPIGALLVAVVLFLPNGIMGGLSKLIASNACPSWLARLVSAPVRRGSA